MALPHRYLIALGSNQRHPRLGSPRAVVRTAMVDLGAIAASRIIDSRPVGPSQRTYANAAAVIDSALEPPALLRALKAMERRYGRITRGQRWQARVLDLDIILWTGGAWHTPALTIPHRAFHDRLFVLRPAAEVAPNWRDPLHGHTVRQNLVRALRPNVAK